jgi:LysR family transcriptional regulator, nitrogen assimilation regulatory protein
MDLKQIQYFIALFEDGSVTRAAKRLNTVQPALSMQISKLEAELRQTLFERGPHGRRPKRRASCIASTRRSCAKSTTHASN